MPRDYEITPNPKGGWDVIADGGKRASSHHDTQKAAHAAARLYATKAGGGEIRIHGKDGQIRQSDTIAKPDPFPPRG
jgi:Uncharacterized protein conserved in bacteria (DUF2188)